VPTVDAAIWPVEQIPTDKPEEGPRDETGLCLSGGGVRAMLFHLGALWRLNELGLLRGLDRVSSVSGGSITAGVLGTRWRELTFDPSTNVATNLESGAVWRFSRPYAWDWRVGKIANPTFPVAMAVAASGAFPPFFAPLVLDVQPSDFEPGSGDGLELDAFRRKVHLADGGAYDNLGLETVFKRCRRIYVSDGGGKLDDDAAPASDWVRETLRTMKVIDNQVRSLRKRLLWSAYERGDRQGAYWGIRSATAEYRVDGALPCDPAATRSLAEMPTRLAKVPGDRQRALINWGYAIADAAIRAGSPGVYSAPSGFPYPGGVG
jgi:NTE family protein